MLTQAQQLKLFINKLKVGAGKCPTTKTFQMFLVAAKKTPTQSNQTQTKINKEKNPNQNQIKKKTTSRTRNFSISQVSELVKLGVEQQLHMESKCFKTIYHLANRKKGQFLTHLYIV